MCKNLIANIYDETAAWQMALTDAVTDLTELCDILELPVSMVSAQASCDYPLRVTRSFLQRIEKGNPYDPLLLQILPQPQELDIVPGFCTDPLQEMSCVNHSDVGTTSQLQKYSGRILLLLTKGCATHCRFCFRRHYSKGMPIIKINTDMPFVLPKHVREVILSGGDPLVLNDTILKQTLNYIKESHAGNRVRVHTRLPIMIPERITDDLIHVFCEYMNDVLGGSVIFVLHVNHPNELSHDVIRAITKIINVGIPVLSQSVLLNNINDQFETLFALYEKLINCRVIPYYLHHLDQTSGTSHFHVSIERGINLISQLRACLPGYAVPQYVREVVGQTSKQILYNI